MASMRTMLSPSATSVAFSMIGKISPRCRGGMDGSLCLPHRPETKRSVDGHPHGCVKGAKTWESAEVCWALSVGCLPANFVIPDEFEVRNVAPASCGSSFPIYPSLSLLMHPPRASHAPIPPSATVRTAHPSIAQAYPSRRRSAKTGRRAVSISSDDAITIHGSDSEPEDVRAVNVEGWFVVPIGNEPGVYNS